MFDANTTLLIPRPGFSLYRTHAQGKGFPFREYNLDVRTPAPLTFSPPATGR